MSIKDELHRLVDELPEHELTALERLLRAPRLPDGMTLATPIGEQGFVPLRDPLALAEGVWPEDEPVDRFLAARETWQHEGEDA